MGLIDLAVENMDFELGAYIRDVRDALPPDHRDDYFVLAKLVSRLKHYEIGTASRNTPADPTGEPVPRETVKAKVAALGANIQTLSKKGQAAEAYSTECSEIMVDLDAVELRVAAFQEKFSENPGAPFSSLVQLVTAGMNTEHVEVNEADDPAGWKHLNIHAEDYELCIDYHPKHGFGISTFDRHSHPLAGMFDRADERYKTVDETLARICELLRSRQVTESGLPQDEGPKVVDIPIASVGPAAPISDAKSPAQVIADWLNAMVERDPPATNTLIQRKLVRCGTVLADDPHLGVREEPDSYFSVTTLGFLNGVLSLLGLGKIVAEFREALPDEDGLLRLTAFRAEPGVTAEAPEVTPETNMMLNLYMLSQSVNKEYDTYDSAIVAAESVEDARRIHPGGNTYGEKWWAGDTPSGLHCWARPGQLDVKLIGVATADVSRGVILASFNAG